MPAPAILHFGSPAPQSPRSLADVEALAADAGPRSVLSNEGERASGRDRAMTYAISIAKEGDTTAEKLIEDSKTIYNYLYTDSDGSATTA